MTTALELPDFARLRIAVVGDAVADRYVHARPQRLSREAPVPVFVEEREEIRPGGAANVAANLAALGCRTTLFAVLSSDGVGRALATDLGARGVHVPEVGSDANYATPIKTRVLASEPHRTPQQVLRLDREPAAPPRASTYAALAEALVEGTFDAVLYSDYGYGDLGVFAAADFELRERGVTRVLDPRAHMPPFARLDAVTPNLEDFTRLCGAKPVGHGTSVRDEPLFDRLMPLVSDWRERIGVRAVLVTLGNRGMLLATERGLAHVGPSGRDGVVDVSGAGDTAAAVFAATLAVGRAPTEAMRLANAAAGEVVMISGTAPIERDRLARAIRTAPVPTPLGGGASS